VDLVVELADGDPAQTLGTPHKSEPGGEP
jgi:hypothetical protein